MNNDVKHTILLVEDEALIAMSEKTELEEYGYMVHHVTIGEKAVQTITDNVLLIDLILMDIDLGSGIDGTQAAEQILKVTDIPIVFLSSHTEPSIVEKTEKITSYGYVVKNSGIVILDASIKMAFKLFNANIKTKLTNDKLKSTVENLKTHQVELQMQNEELCEKQAELEALQLKYFDLYDMAPAGYFTLSKTGLILEANLTGADLLGVARSSLLKQPFSSFIIQEDQDIFYMHRKALFEDGVPQTCDLRLRKKNGSIFPAYIKAIATAHNENDSESCRIIMMEHDVPQQNINHKDGRI